MEERGEEHPAIVSSEVALLSAEVDLLTAQIDLLEVETDMAEDQYITPDNCDSGASMTSSVP